MKLLGSTTFLSAVALATSSFCADVFGPLQIRNHNKWGATDPLKGQCMGYKPDGDLIPTPCTGDTDQNFKLDLTNRLVVEGGSLAGQCIDRKGYTPTDVNMTMKICDLDNLWQTWELKEKPDPRFDRRISFLSAHPTMPPDQWQLHTCSTADATGDVILFDSDCINEETATPWWHLVFNCPSDQPSTQPSAQHSTQPSKQPSNIPTSIPSTQPSWKPSTAPSSIPSKYPSSIPSSQPSRQPSTIPSKQPSSIPSSQPSSIPSSIPSTHPSSTPSSQPSKQPSTIPSKQPSSIPSSQPSSIPSSIPSRQPSSIPSLQPSRQPSSIPSSQPSNIPSLQPSRQPSSIPSGQPSIIPSKQPSLTPSSIPSMQPTSIPSVQPTSQPSDTPITPPSCTPSVSPSDPATLNLFYPDWSSTTSGCKNDGSEPSHMSANPHYYMSSTLNKCCTTNFGWKYDVCMGNERGVCSRALWYPDLEGRNEGCVNDGNEPKYMTDNVVNFMFMELHDCCKQHYKWDHHTCTKATSTLNTALYYPDFGGSKSICKNEGSQPTYMNNSPSIWMHATLKECCIINYWYDYNECIGSGSTDISSGSATARAVGLYYPDWLGAVKTCRNDNGQPSYMTSNPTLWMHVTAAACCKKNYSWDEDTCLGTVGTLRTGTGATTSRTGTGKFYKRAADWSCVQNCIGSSPCGGVKSSWETDSYATRKTCCASIPYEEDCMTRMISPSS